MVTKPYNCLMFSSLLTVLLPLGTALLTPLPVTAQEFTISSFAGTGEPGFSGDGGPASAARLEFPTGVAVDGEGNVYIADSGNRRIRRVDLAGTISSFAGTGEPGFSGDGGPASAARLDFPTGVAVDGEGNVYIADSGNRRIRRVDLAGTISSFAGTGEPGFSGDGGPASAARLGNPWNVAVDGEGNVYIADSGNRRIRRVDLAGTISSFAGTGEPGFSGDGGPASAARLGNPWNVAVDGEGNVYIADSGNRIRRVDLAGTISSFAGIGEPGFSGDGGPASAARLGYPEGIAVDGEGNVYIADSSNRRIRRVDLAGTISSFAGTGEPGFSGGWWSGERGAAQLPNGDSSGWGGQRLHRRSARPPCPQADAGGRLRVSESDRAVHHAAVFHLSRLDSGNRTSNWKGLPAKKGPN